MGYRLLILSLIFNIFSSTLFGDEIDSYKRVFTKKTDGVISSRVVGYIKDEKPIGSWTFYKEIDGSLKVVQIENYKNGVSHGDWKTYFDSGQLSSERTFKDGKVDGSWIVYYEDGSIKFKSEFTLGRLDGSYQLYYEDGSLKESGEFKDNSGVLTKYYRDGSIKGRGSLVDGYEDGVWLYFNRDGKVVEKRTYFDEDLQNIEYPSL